MAQAGAAWTTPNRFARKAANSTFLRRTNTAGDNSPVAYRMAAATAIGELDALTDRMSGWTT